MFDEEDIIFEAKKANDSLISIIFSAILLLLFGLLLFNTIKKFLLTDIIIPVMIIMLLIYIIILIGHILIIKHNIKDRLYITSSFIIMSVGGCNTKIEAEDVIAFSEFLAGRFSRYGGILTLIKTKNSEFVFPHRISNFDEFGKYLTSVSKNFSINKQKLTLINIKFLHCVYSLLCVFVCAVLVEEFFIYTIKNDIYNNIFMLICVVVFVLHILFFLYLFYKKYFTEEYRLIMEAVKKEKQINNEKNDSVDDIEWKRCINNFLGKNFESEQEKEIPDGEICPICGQKMYKKESSCHNCHIFHK